MIQRGGRPCLAEQLLEGIALTRRGDELQRHLAIQHHVFGETDFAHAAAADGFDDVIAGFRHLVTDA
jgi:hypothetical protein